MDKSSLSSVKENWKFIYILYVGKGILEGACDVSVTISVELHFFFLLLVHFDVTTWQLFILVEDLGNTFVLLYVDLDVWIGPQERGNLLSESIAKLKNFNKAILQIWVSGKLFISW